MLYTVTLSFFYAFNNLYFVSLLFFLFLTHFVHLFPSQILLHLMNLFLFFSEFFKAFLLFYFFDGCAFLPLFSLFLSVIPQPFIDHSSVLFLFLLGVYLEKDS